MYYVSLYSSTSDFYIQSTHTRMHARAHINFRNKNKQYTKRTQLSSGLDISGGCAWVLEILVEIVGWPPVHLQNNTTAQKGTEIYLFVHMFR